MSLTITFLSDYGHQDEFVGVVHGVIDRLAPGARVIDLGHGVPRHDIRAGALMLVRSLPYTAPGVHLAVVDPGVGGSRRAVALRTEKEGRLLVGPDNGLLAPAAEAFGGVAEAVEISESDWRLEPVSPTFHGRDVFAPVGARLSAGEKLRAAGRLLDPATLTRLPVPSPRRRADGGLACVVLGSDAYGNLQLATGGLAAAGLSPGSLVTVEAGGRRKPARCTRTFAEVPHGALLVYEDGGGMLALAVNGGDAAALLEVGAGDPVGLVPG